MSFMIKDKQLLKSCNKIWKKIKKLMKIDFNTKTTYGDDDKYIKPKIKAYRDSITTNFYNKKGSKKYQKKKYRINVYREQIQGFNNVELNSMYY